MVNKMEKEYNVIGIIHARGGSKRIPLKNIVLLGGKPLISYIIKAALASRSLRRVIVSTDHNDIKRIALENGAEVPFMRPAEIAEDCPSELVTQHAVNFIENQESKKIDIAVTLQPTAPFCRAEDIDACIDILRSNPELKSAFSAKTVHERPEWMFAVKEDKRADIFMQGQIKGNRGIFQSLQKLVMPNGGIYATRRQTLFEEGVVISNKTGVHIMPDERSVDIDEPIDLQFAEFLKSGGKV